jgi:hypothetical protein
VDVAEIAPGLWRWTAPHPAWSEADADDWARDVGCVYAEVEGGIALIDPLVPADLDERERFWRALDRDVERLGAPHVFFTCPDHLRSSVEIDARYDADASEVAGVVALPTERVGEIVYWLPAHRALVPGDVLLGDGEGGVRVCPDDWLEGADRDAVWASLEPLLDLPVERILVSHGEPVLADGAAALRRALRDEG